MQTLAEIKELLEGCGSTPKRSLGQNFLIDHNLIRKLVDAAAISPGEVVLEVGPGTGTMSEELIDRGAQLVACELDDRFAEMLSRRIPERLIKLGRPAGAFTLVHGDCLAGKHAVNPAIIRSLKHMGAERYKLVANLPYGAGTPLMSALLIDHPECEVLAVTIQREVADRLLAKPGSKEFGAMAVIAQSLCSVERVAVAPPECFWPRPDVTSAMVVLRRLAAPRVSDARVLSAGCRVLFAQRRKQLGGIVGKLVEFDALRALAGCHELTPNLRAEQLSVEQIVAICEKLGARPSEQGARDLD